LDRAFISWLPWKNSSSPEEAQMLKAAGLYTAVFVVGTATMILAHKLDPQKPIRSAGAVFFEKRMSGTAFPELKFIKSPLEAQDI
jgi:hypothetical protein